MAELGSGIGVSFRIGGRPFAGAEVAVTEDLLRFGGILNDLLGARDKDR